MYRIHMDFYFCNDLVASPESLMNSGFSYSKVKLVAKANAAIPQKY